MLLGKGPNPSRTILGASWGKVSPGARMGRGVLLDVEPCDLLTQPALRNARPFVNFNLFVARYPLQLMLNLNGRHFQRKTRFSRSPDVPALWVLRMYICRK